MADRKPVIVIDLSRCRGNGACVKVCPERALTMHQGKAVIDHARCDLDGLCIPACPHGAISFKTQ